MNNADNNKERADQAHDDSALLRVLILDDDPFTLSVLQDMLAVHGHYDATTQTDARRALRMLAAPSPDLLICDLSMPDMDGIEFMQAAAQAGYGGAVLLLSGMDLGVRTAAEHLGRAHGLNLVGAYRKPLQQDQLDRVLTALREAKTEGKNAPQENSHNLTPLFGK
jgi:CheY-like chemotaxis protein